MKKNKTAALGLSLLSGCVLQAAEPSNSQKPNIVYVLFDDMGYGQPQCYNPASALRTPNLDKFSTEAMLFTDAHSASAVSTPTRYGILTGRYPSRIGQYGVLESFSKPIIPTTRLTVASMLKKQGYATACIGKWHLGMNWSSEEVDKNNLIPIGTKTENGPNALGFDYFTGYTHARNIGSIIEQNEVVAQVKPEECQPLMIKKAVEWIDQQANKDKPFFLYFPMCPPHEPLVPSAEYIGKSNAKDIVKKSPKYGDWLFQGDAMLGQILEALKRNHLDENTIVIVASDNGAEHRAYEPLRESKRSIYEGGHRVPFVVRWTGKIKPGTKNQQVICLNDFMATAAEISGAKLPPNAAEDSRSILPELLGTSNNMQENAIIHQSMSGDLAIRKGDWKLIFNTTNKQELYNIAADISETKDLAASQPEIVKELTALIKKYINNGRITKGKTQKNDLPISIDGPQKDQTSIEKKKEAVNAADPSFD